MRKECGLVSATSGVEVAGNTESGEDVIPPVECGRYGEDGSASSLVSHATKLIFLRPRD